MISYTGLLPGRGRLVSTSARCMVYNHKKDSVYLSTENKDLAIQIVCTQSERDPKGEYRAYELTGDDWRQIRITITKAPEQPGRSPDAPPLFLC